MLAASAAAKPGDLDLFFNPTGEGETMPGMVLGPPSNGTNSLKRIALLPDGAIAGIGVVSDHSSVIRWLPDGSLDPAFGNGGIARSPFYVDMFGMAVQADGKILVAGSSGTSATVQRFLPDGMPDPSFGDGGRVILAFPDHSGTAMSVAVLSDGKIVAGGQLRQEPSGITRPHFWKMLPDGHPDLTFGSGGGVTLSDQGYVSEIAVQPDGKIVATGTTVSAVPGGWVGRIKADGAVDALFRGGGRFLIASPANPDGSQMKLLLQSDGKILIAADFERSVNDSLYFVNRYDHDGNPDPGFGGTGAITTNITPGFDSLVAATLQADGKLLVTGSSGMGEIVLIRYLTDGTLDAGFADGGIAKFRTPQGTTGVSTMAVLPDSKILLGGSSFFRGQLMLLRVSNSSLPESLSGEWPAGTPLKNGGRVEFVPVLKGAPEPRETTLTLRNTGAARLTNLSMSLAGPGAAHFELLSTLPASLNTGESTTLRVRFLPASEISIFAASLTIETGDPGIEDFLLVLRGTTGLPLTTLSLFSDGSTAVPDKATVDFGPALATHPVTKTFTLKNNGNIELLIQGITLGTAGMPGDFTVGVLESDVLPPGGTTTFPVTFTPGARGTRTAGLRIASTDTLNPPYEVTLAGSRAAGLDAWRLTHFGTLLDEGDAADLADPDHDGVVNLMEYATLTEPAAPNPPAGEVILKGNTLEYTFLRPAEAADRLNYTIERAGSVHGPWQPADSASLTELSIDARQQVKFSLPVTTSSRGFVRLRVDRK